MVQSYGDFPGVRVETAGGGITAVSIGEEEKLFLFGEASYQNDGDFSPGDGNEDPLESSLSGSTEQPEQINARREADSKFGSGSELADGMREALSNEANIDYLYGVAPKRYNVVDESQPNQSGTLNNPPVWEEDVSDESNIQVLTVDDTSGPSDIPVRYSYQSPLPTPSDDTTDVDTVVVNPLTGEYQADETPSGDFSFSYKYLDWQSALEAKAVSQEINEGETAIFLSLSDSDVVSGFADGAAETLREEFQLVNGLSGAQPNADQQIDDSNGDYVRRDARFDTSTFSQGSVDSDHYFKPGPVRLNNTTKTILGGIGGLFAGNPINDPIYNETLTGYDELEQQIKRQDAQDLRDKNVIPVRQGGSIRVKDNKSTSTETDWERDFWRRRIVDRVILIGKDVGDSIIGRINNEQTRNATERLIRNELRQLVEDGLLKPNTGAETNWYVDVSEDSVESDQVNIDIGITPYGVVKRIDETVTISN